MQARPVMSFTQRLEDAIAYDGEEGYCDEREEESLEYLFGLFLFLGFACFEFGLVLLIHSKRVLLVWLIKMLLSSGGRRIKCGTKRIYRSPTLVHSEITVVLARRTP